MAAVDDDSSGLPANMPTTRSFQRRAVVVLAAEVVPDAREPACEGRSTGWGAAALGNSLSHAWSQLDVLVVSVEVSTSLICGVGGLPVEECGGGGGDGRRVARRSPVAPFRAPTRHQQTMPNQTQTLMFGLLRLFC